MTSFKVSTPSPPCLVNFFLNVVNVLNTRWANRGSNEVTARSIRARLVRSSESGDEKSGGEKSQGVLVEREVWEGSTDLA